MASISIPPLRAWLRWTLIVGVAGFVGLLALGAVVLRDQIFQTFLDPGVPYQTYQKPPAPDYTQEAAWLSRPALRFGDEEGAPAVFFVHPTTYDGGAHWNAPFDRPQEVDELRRIVLPNYAAPFLSNEIDLYAPHYRQAALYAFMNNREDSVQARLLAQADVQAAFAQFLRESDPEQPFFLVGVDQGAAIALAILMDQIAPDAGLRARLAAAYLIDAPVPLDLLAGPLMDIPVCAQPDSVRCLVSWNAARADEHERVAAITERSLALDGVGALEPTLDRGLVCVNPVLWTAGEDFAPARLHQGGAAAEGLSLTDAPSPMPSQTATQCQDGVLIIDRPRAEPLRRPGRLSEDRRFRPANLFYMDMRTNAAARLAAIEAILAEEARYAPPLDAPVEVETAPVRPIDG